MKSPAVFWLLLGVFSCSTSVIFIKLSETQEALLSAYRLWFAMLILLPIFLREWWKHRQHFHLGHWKRAMAPGIALGLHLISWTYGARWTNAANASLIVNLVPVAMPLLLLLLTNERVTRRELLGTGIAMAGLFLLTGGDVLKGGGNFLGDVVCFGSMLLFTAYLAWGRRNYDFPSIWLYVFPVYLYACAISFLVAVPLTDSLLPASGREWLLLAGMGLVPTVLGHSLLNLALRSMRGQVVSLFNLAQFVFAGVMAWFFFRELPGLLFGFASLLIVYGAYVAIQAKPTHPAPPTSCPLPSRNAAN